MAAIVCHGLQLSLESQLVESRIHSFRLPSPKPLTPKTIDLSFKSCSLESNTNTKPHYEDNNQGSWSSIQVLSNVSQSQTTKEFTYVPPQVKLSWMQLSRKSLELCTENLGNETGTDIKESNIDLLSSSNSGGGNLESKDERKSSQVLEAKKAKTKNFPPPLTTMRGSESLRVKPHREDGRLVIEVTKVPSSASCFQAERSHGRLRLCFWTDPEDEEDIENEEQEDEEEEEEEEVVEEDFDEVENENEGGDRETRVRGYKERKGNSIWNIESDVRKEKYERETRRRCKEGGHENNELLLLVNKSWGEPLWVATS